MTNSVSGSRIADLVGLAKDGDSAAWGQLVEQFSPLLWSICRRYRLSDADCDDVAAAVWLRMVEKLRQLREPEALPGWLSTVTQRECFRVIKASQRLRPVESELFPDLGEPGADEVLLEEERRQALRTAFADLSDRCQALISRLFGDPPRPYTDIAGELRMAVGSIGPTRMRCLWDLQRHPALARLADIPNQRLGGD